MTEKYNQVKKTCFHDDGKIHQERAAWMMVENTSRKKCLDSTNTK